MKKLFSAAAFAAAFLLIPAAAWANHADSATVDCSSYAATLRDFPSGTYAFTLTVDVDGAVSTFDQQLVMAHGRPDTPISFDISSATDAHGQQVNVTATLSWVGKVSHSAPPVAYAGVCGTPETTTTTPTTTTEKPKPPAEKTVAPPSYGGGDIGTPISVGKPEAPKPAPAPKDELPRTGSDGVVALVGFLLLAAGFCCWWFSRDRSRGWWDSQAPTNRLD